MPHSEKPSGRRLGHRTARAGAPAKRTRPRPPVQILDPDGVLAPRDKSAIEREASKLAALAPRIVEVRIGVTVPHRRLHREVIRYRVQLRIAVPLEELVIKRQEDANLLTAMQEAFAAGRRVVQDYVRRHRDPPAPTEGPARGRVARLLTYDGYGFIEGDEGEEVYFDRNAVIGAGFDRLSVGRRVRYVAESGRRGLQASTVTPGPAQRIRKPA